MFRKMLLNIEILSKDENFPSVMYKKINKERFSDEFMIILLFYYGDKET